MKIIVVGCGKIGRTLVQNLVLEGHDVVAIDSETSVLEEITNMYDVMCVCGNGVDYDTLFEAGAKQAEIVISVTGSDEFNMLSCFMAKRMGAQHTIARIRNPGYNGHDYAFVKQHLELSLAINPELLAAHEIFNILKLPSAVNVETFSRRNFEMVEIRLKPESALHDMKVMEVRKKYPGNFLISVVQREDKVFIPDGNFVLKSGDKIGLIAAPTEIQKLLKKLGILQKQARNVMILGGGKIGYYLAKMLLGSGNSVKIIDRDIERCKELSNELTGAVIINGNGAEQEVLLSEGINNVDAFVALTGMDEENILISFYASSQNVPKVISKVNRAEIAAMAEKLGLDSIISPKKSVTDVILSYARAIQNSVGSKVETLYKLMDDKAEALEFIVGEDFKSLGVPLKDMKIKDDILIAGIISGRKAIIPSGEDVIDVGDRVIVIAAGQKMDDLSDILK